MISKLIILMTLLTLHTDTYLDDILNINFAIASSHVADLNTHNKLLTQKFLKQGFSKLFLNFTADTMI